MRRILKGNWASSWIEHIYRLHSPPWCFLRPLIRTRRIEISVMAFLWQVKDKATIFQSISPGNMLINHQRLGLCYSDCKKESSVVSVWVKWDALLLNTFGYHQGLVASTFDSFEHSNFTYHADGSVWDKSYLECVWRCQFSKSNKGTIKAAGIYLSVNSASSAVSIYYHPYWSSFIFIRSKGHNGKGQQTLKKDRKKNKLNDNKHTFKFPLFGIPFPLFPLL